MQLNSRESITPLQFTLTQEDWRWLGEKQSVKVAIYSPENPPFTLIPETGIFEGVSADYSQLILRYLGLRFQVLYYTSRAAALEGLRSGAADILIDDDDSIHTLPPGIIGSEHYMSDYPALVSRETAVSRPLSIPSDSRIAIAQGYLSNEWVKRYYPEAKITRYASPESALSAVAFGETDYFIGNLATASYLIERNYATTLSVSDIYSDVETGPRFVFPERENVLQRAFNTVLKAIPPAHHKVILRHWAREPNLWRFQPHLPLTDREERWLARNNDLRVVINPFYAPFTLFDTKKQFHGISADILRLIHLRTGLNFKIVEADSVEDMFGAVQQHQGDFIAAMSYSPQRDKQLLFTRPYILPPFVLVVRDIMTAPHGLAENLTVAITPDNNLRNWLKKQFPSLTLIDADNASAAMRMVKEGKADGAVNNLIEARDQIDRYFRGELKIAARLGEEPARISFAVGRDQPELYSILNKALADLPPKDISTIANRWQGTPSVKPNTWAAYRSEFYWLAGIFVILVITSVVWNYCIHREILLRKEAQARLQEQATLRETFFDGTPVPVYVVDVLGNIINYNSSWRAFFATASTAPSQQTMGSPDHPLAVIFEDLLPLLNAFETMASAPQRYRISNGTEDRIILHQAVTYKDNTGAVAGLIGSWQDITAHEALLEELSVARERAEQANRTKSTFLATMSHEIRTPISAIIGLLELEVTSPARQHTRAEKESVQVAYESALSLMGLVGDILDLAKIESGKLELMPDWVSPDKVVLPVVQVFAGLARQKGLVLEYNVDALHPDEISIDTIRVRQILSNLVSNAIKFTEQGSVSVQLQFQPHTSTQSMLTLSVKDTGKGVAEDEQANLFAPYVQSETGRNQNGTGLGLAICSQLAAMMRGTIELQSQPGCGTQVTVSFPVACRQKQLPSADITSEVITGTELPLRILTVDDHPANRLLLTRQLTRLGHHVIEAVNGQEALSMWHEQAVDLVITDCNMPVMDGFELTRLLRQKQSKPLMILGLTANAQPEERERCIAAGMDDCLFKPLRLSQLDLLLRKIPRGHASRTSDDSPALNDLVNLSALNELTQDDKALLNTLLHTTRDENIRDMEQSQRFLEQDAWGDLTRSLHRLAGAAQIIGATEAEAHCRGLEKYCEKTPSPDKQQVSQHLQQALIVLATLNQAIDQFTAS